MPAVRDRKDVLILNEEEIEELYRFTRQMYLDPARWPHLRKLLDRVDAQRLMRARLGS